MKKNKIIKLFDPSVNNEEIRVTSKIIKEKFWASGAGVGKVKEFEENFSKYIGCKQTVALNSGTAALHLALSVLGIKGKEILLPSITFSSTALAILYNQAKPKFVEVDETTLNIDTEDLTKKITKKTAVIIPVHFGGHPCNLGKIQKIKNEFNLHVIEDAAHACGATHEDKRIGSHSEMVCFSFHPVKNLAMPSGGAITLNSNVKNLNLLKSMRWCGITNRKKSFYDISLVGWNYYMNEIAAGIGLVQMKKLDGMNKIRKKIARKYNKEICLDHKAPFDNNCSYHLYWIRVKDRKRFMKQMLNVGIETGIHYRPLHKMSLFKNKLKLPLTERVSKEIVSIPMHPNLTEEETDKVVNSINKFS